MSDWVDEQIGGVCTVLKDAIQENPALLPSVGARQRFIQWMEECAAKPEGDDDRIGAFNWELRRIDEAYFRETGTRLIPSRSA